MRRALLFLHFFVLVLLPVAHAVAATCTAVGNGDWTATSTWSGNTVPQAGDLIIIPSSREVRITTNITYSGAAMRIQVNGTLRFVGGGAKIALPCGSILELMTPAATVLGNSSGSSQTIRICGVTYWSVSDGPLSGYGVWPPNATLPVELLSFTGTNVDGTVHLAWSTATESSSAHFEVQRSADAMAFTSFSTVAAAGWSVARIDYATHDDPPTSGTWYYRLLQHDLDGTVQALSTVAVRTGPAPGLICSPVPASDRIECVTADLPATLIVSDLSGNAVLEHALLEERSTLDVSDLPSGPYLVRIVHGGVVNAQRILVAHE